MLFRSRYFQDVALVLPDDGVTQSLPTVDRTHAPFQVRGNRKQRAGVSRNEKPRQAYAQQIRTARLILSREERHVMNRLIRLQGDGNVPYLFGPFAYHDDMLHVLPAVVGRNTLNKLVTISENRAKNFQNGDLCMRRAWEPGHQHGGCENNPRSSRQNHVTDAPSSRQTSIPVVSYRLMEPKSSVSEKNRPGRVYRRERSGTWRGALKGLAPAWQQTATAQTDRHGLACLPV